MRIYVTRFLCGAVLFSFIFTSGCWDRNEVNNLAFVMASAFDLTDDGKILITAQIAIPSGIGQAGSQGKGGGKESFLVISATGKNIRDTIPKIQAKLSRKLYYAHRGVVIFGEPLAKHGLKNALDHFTRDPKNRLRTYILVAKGVEAREILHIRYPFENVPASATRGMEMLGINSGTTFRDFLMAASSEGANPVSGAVEPIPAEVRLTDSKQLFRLAGTALFKDLKLKGYLNEQETEGYLWIVNKLKHGQIIANLPRKGDNVSLALTKASRQIKSEVHGEKVLFHLQLKGEGSIFENNSPMELSQLKNLQIAQTALENTEREHIENLLKRVQKDEQADVFEFGQELYRSRPKQWKTLKKQWNQRFAEAEFSVEVHINIRGIGMVSAPLELKEKEIVKE